MDVVRDSRRNVRISSIMPFESAGNRVFTGVGTANTALKNRLQAYGITIIRPVI